MLLGGTDIRCIAGCCHIEQHLGSRLHPTLSLAELLVGHTEVVVDLKPTKHNVATLKTKNWTVDGYRLLAISIQCVNRKQAGNA